MNRKLLLTLLLAASSATGQTYSGNSGPKEGSGTQEIDPYGCGAYMEQPLQYACGAAFLHVASGNVWLEAPVRLSTVENTDCSLNVGPGPSGYSWGIGSPGAWRCTGDCGGPSGKWEGNRYNIFTVLIRVPFLKADSIPTFSLNPVFGIGAAMYPALVDTSTSNALYNIVDFAIEMSDPAVKMLTGMNEYMRDPTKYPRPYFWLGVLTGGDFLKTAGITDENCTGCEYIEAPSITVSGITWAVSNGECPKMGMPIFAVDPTAITTVAGSAARVRPTVAP